MSAIWLCAGRVDKNAQQPAALYAGKDAAARPSGLYRHIDASEFLQAATENRFVGIQRQSESLARYLGGYAKHTM